MKKLSSKDVLALGFMTFALFVGAGNIIFPPIIGFQTGGNVWFAAIGFLITGVGLPLITIISLAKVGGLKELSSPIGKACGLLLATICYLSVGPLFAIPRTATVSFELGIALITKEGKFPLLIYSIVYFLLVIYVSLYPKKLLDNVGYILAPIKIIALAILAISAILAPVGEPIKAVDSNSENPFISGFLNGYLTMDALAAMMFGSIIVNAVRSRGIESDKLLNKYIIKATFIAGLFLILIYLALFKLGADSGTFLSSAENGAVILRSYVQYIFGIYGSAFLAILIFIACLVTAVGLTCACAEFFNSYLPLSYKKLVIIFGLFSMIISNLGLNHLIQFSIPLLTAIYPPCIILVLLSFTRNYWGNFSFILAPTMAISLVFGFFDAVKSFDYFSFFIPSWFNTIPLSNHQLAWLLPSLFIMFTLMVIDRLFLLRSGNSA
ncbi:MULTISPECIES: branched-chain amino acid transport system II carrier protein [Xenorhabdus]|uniref:branched-chain amino acid transport system II carrier protein n=1 Tax=Xenorhabdus TaxID=626 RepID=UPI00064938EF|nr:MULTISPECIES: branched-chain amino acid transport system II carrier protein [Xenorhabdus]KLU14611.1 branched-chain amino acid ABC transporter substrate-binding protein [Xenorhabdus griffiniae]KOP32515.1 branched-chain amino acid ABC transporter substrate-binding protein [Xenorhabdus sp. GDc328]